MNLKDIKSPADIKGKSITELANLAAQIRMALLEKLSRHGGHVGPNLGFVEATIALHYVFDSPKDKIVFDVSHQSYTHKMLTGRVRAFIDPSHYDDVTGFTSPGESEHDFFTIGHTSTAASLACGLAKARDLQGGKENIIAVIGDGSLSGGEAFEGLDNAAVLNSNFIVVINDNEMSIAENHGGLYADLRLLRNTKGEAPVNYFRSLGFAYRYVAEGNNLSKLIAAFEEVKDTDHPVVVHIHTEKGQGFRPALLDKEKWHFESPFDTATGLVFADEDNTPYWDDYVYEFCSKELAENPKAVVVNAGTPAVMGFNLERRRAAGGRFIDVGIAEEHAAAMSSGMAKAGMHPYWGVMSTFVQRAYDQISQDIAINNNPVVIGVMGCGVLGMNDVTHLCWFDIPMLSNIPNVVMLAPTCPEEYKAMATWAMRQSDHPVVLRIPATVEKVDGPFDTDYSDLNTFRQVRSGHDVAIIAVGAMLPAALRAAEQLAAKGVEATVINPRFVSGIDEEMLSSLEPDHKAVITVEDGVLDGGFGEKIARFYSDRPMLVKCLGVRKQFLDKVNQQELAARSGLTADGIVEAYSTMFK